MSGTDIQKTKKRRKSKKKSNKIISFDDEVVTKSVAEKLNNTESHKNSKNLSPEAVSQKQNNKPEMHPSQEQTEFQKHKIPKRKKNKEMSINSKLENHSESNEKPENEEPALNPTNPKIEKEESKRAQKRKKHEQLLSAKKLKVDLAMQDKCLNYLSIWKHSRSDWKFEKLRQVWLQQNMFDSDKIPVQFWETLVEYFSNAKGKIRQTIMDDALKIIETAEFSISQNDDEKTKVEDENQNNGTSEIKVQRAKNIIQSLQE